jgi:hypothetical protein
VKALSHECGVVAVRRVRRGDDTLADSDWRHEVTERTVALEGEGGVGENETEEESSRRRKRSRKTMMMISDNITRIVSGINVRYIKDLFSMQ